MASFNYIARKLGGKDYKVVIKKPNEEEGSWETVTVFGVLQLMQKRTLTKFGETEDFEGEFYTETKLIDEPETTLLLQDLGKSYSLLLQYNLSNQAGVLAKISHFCYRLKEYGNAGE